MKKFHSIENLEDYANYKVDYLGTKRRNSCAARTRMNLNQTLKKNCLIGLEPYKGLKKGNPILGNDYKKAKIIEDLGLIRHKGNEFFGRNSSLALGDLYGEKMSKKIISKLKLHKVARKLEEFYYFKAQAEKHSIYSPDTPSNLDQKMHLKFHSKSKSDSNYQLPFKSPKFKPIHTFKNQKTKAIDKIISDCEKLQKESFKPRFTREPRKLRISKLEKSKIKFYQTILN